jgi:hypothetical protein
MTDDKRQIKTLTTPKCANLHNFYTADEHTLARMIVGDSNRYSFIRS